MIDSPVIDYVAIKLAKRSCRKCYGRGTMEMSVPRPGVTIRYLRYCDCVLNKPQLQDTIKETLELQASLDAAAR